MNTASVAYPDQNIQPTDYSLSATSRQSTLFAGASWTLTSLLVGWAQSSASLALGTVLLGLLLISRNRRYSAMKLQINATDPFSAGSPEILICRSLPGEALWLSCRVALTSRYCTLLRSTAPGFMPGRVIPLWRDQVPEYVWKQLLRSAT